MEIDLALYKKRLKEDEDLVDYLIDKSEQSKWFYERWLYFTNCAGEACKYADACIKLMKQEIDDYYNRHVQEDARGR